MTVTIGYIGMTHLGLVSASGTCSKGFKTFCFDRDKTLISRLNDGKLPIVEPGLDDMIAANGPNQIFTHDFDEIALCDVVYIAPDVPTDDQGSSDLSGINVLIGEIIPKLNDDAILVILCQVPPGFTRAISVSPDRLYYQVETLVFGQAAERATRPERLIIGCADPAKALPDAYHQLLGAFDCPILPMRYESAELAKISINMCLISSISVANTLAELCEHIGADWSEIAPALKLDKRIGAYSYLDPGLGIAGGNLERDMQTVINLAGAHGTDAGVISAFTHNSRHRRDWALKCLQENMLATQADPLIAIWGLAYKADTDSIKNSPSLATIEQLPDVKLHVHDPVVLAKDPKLQQTKTAMEAVRDADALMVMTPWPEYKTYDLKEIAKAMAGKTLIDPYRVFTPKMASAAGLTYHTLGTAPIGPEQKDGKHA